MAEPADAPAHMWFVKTGGEVWGPYPQARVAAFAREGRVRAATLLSPFAQGPWAPAAETEEFARALPAARTPSPATIPLGRAPPPRAPPPAPAPISEALEPVAFATARPAPGPGGGDRAILVFAELASVAPTAFQAGLARLGRCVQVRPGLWLLRAPQSAASLRNMLSSRLSAADALLVVEAPLDQAAWFNLAPANDRELRRLWSGG